MLVYLLFSEDYGTTFVPTQILGVFRNTARASGLEIAMGRASLEPDAPAEWHRHEAVSGVLRACWQAEAVGSDRVFIIEQHVVEPVEGPRPTGRRPRSW